MRPEALVLVQEIGQIALPNVYLYISNSYQNALGRIGGGSQLNYRNARLTLRGGTSHQTSNIQGRLPFEGGTSPMRSAFYK